MPLYEYSCHACSERFEVLQTMGEGSDGLACPSCGGGAIERQLSTFAGRTGSAGQTAEACARSGCDSPFT